MMKSGHLLRERPANERQVGRRRLGRVLGAVTGPVVRAGLAAAMLAVAALGATAFAAGCGRGPAGAVSEADWPPVFDTGVDPESWVLVPAGEYRAGQEGHPDTIGEAYEIMVTPVTNTQYARYLNAALAAGAVEVTGEGASLRVVGWYPGDTFHGARHEKPIPAGEWVYLALGDPSCRITFDGAGFGVKPGYENHPVTMVTWFGARGYAEFYGYSLPSERQWEKAARGTDSRPYPWGTGIDPTRANYYHSHDPFEREGRVGDTTPVGFYSGRTYAGFATSDSRSPYGLYDMAGNVGEWTADVYEGTHLRYIRGGSKADYGYDLRVWTRFSAGPDYASPGVGFRCARPPRASGDRARGPKHGGVSDDCA